MIAAVDISNTSQNAHGSLLSITVTNFFASIPVPVNVTSASAVALAVGRLGATTPAFTVDASTASQVAGLKVTGAATAGTVAVVVTDSGADASLTVNAKGTGTIGIGSVSTGRVTITPVTTITGSLTLSAALTYGGVTLTNAVTGTGNMVLSASPTLTGTITVTGATITGLTAASVAAGTFPAGSFSMPTLAVTSSLTVTGATITGLTAASVGAGTFPAGAFVFAGAVSGITTLAIAGALSGVTTVALTGAITQTTVTGAVFTNLGATTANKYINFTNTGGDFILGVERSTTGGLFVGTTAYAAVFGSTGATPVEVATNNNVRTRVEATGAFAALVSVKTGSGSTSVPNLTFTTLFAVTAPGTYLVFAYNAAAVQGASAIMYHDGTTNGVSNPAGLQIGGGGFAWQGAGSLNVQFTQNSGSSQTITWSYLRIN